MDGSPQQELTAWIHYLRDLGILDLYRRPSPAMQVGEDVLERLRTRQSPARGDATLRVSGAATPSEAAGPHRQASSPIPLVPGSTMARHPPQGGVSRTPPPGSGNDTRGRGSASDRPVIDTPEPARAYFSQEAEGSQPLPPGLAAPMPKPNPLESLFPQPLAAVPPADRAAALAKLQDEIGDCTRCPLAYAGRHTIVFGEGDPNAELMFAGEGPGADEDASGRPFVGKAGQLLNNMISAMNLRREQVFIANVVKCRPPGNRTPEFVEATTCSQFLLKQIDIVRPKVIVALGATAATYLLGVRQPLASLRGRWHAARGAKVAVTYHPAFLLRDPRQKAEAWKDLQRVMVELRLQPSAKSG